MKAIIVEDEPLSAMHLKTLLSKTAPEIVVIKILDSIKSTVNYLQENKNFDLIFLDIHLADGNSFEIFQQIEISKPIIFTTAYDEYAIKAFKVNSIDYLLKPIGLIDLKTAINKYNSQNLNQVSNTSSQQKNILEMITKTNKTRFIVKLGENLSSIKIEDIAFFSAEDGIVILTSNDGKRYPIDYTMDVLEGLINQDIFFRINRQMILNINQIQQVQTYFNGRYKIKLKHIINDNIIVSRERVSDFKKWLDK
jgi:DNA-binding LytR/AlgR family response regulator